MAKYSNDFNEVPIDLYDDHGPAWADQPITIPLHEWTELLLDNADLRSRLDALAIRWSESNERIRHLESDLAMMRGAMEGGE